MILHQYLPADDDRIQSLKEHKLWFSNPFRFNDPFELSTTFSDSKAYVPHDLNALISSYANADQNILPRFVNMKMIDALKIGAQNGRYVADRYIDEDIYDLFRSQLEKQGMVCLSRNANSELMWAYYSKGHTGFKVTYEVDEIAAYKYSKILTIDVNYSNHRPQLSCFDLMFTETEIKMLATKSINWAHENEVRLIKHIDNGFPFNSHGVALPMPKGIKVIEVTTGVKIDSNFSIKLREAVDELVTNSGSPIEFSKVEINNETYSLEIAQHFNIQP